MDTSPGPFGHNKIVTHQRKGTNKTKTKTEHSEAKHAVFVPYGHPRITTPGETCWCQGTHRLEREIERKWKEEEIGRNKLAREEEDRDRVIENERTGGTMVKDRCIKNNIKS